MGCDRSKYNGSRSVCCPHIDYNSSSQNVLVHVALTLASLLVGGDALVAC